MEGLYNYCDMIDINIYLYLYISLYIYRSHDRISGSKIPLINAQTLQSLCLFHRVSPCPLKGTCGTKPSPSPLQPCESVVFQDATIKLGPKKSMGHMLLLTGLVGWYILETPSESLYLNSNYDLNA